MRSDIEPGGVFPDYALPDHTGTVPVIQSYQPGEDRWHCYLDDLVFQNNGAPSFEYS
jgi:hypothetical protein